MFPVLTQGHTTAVGIAHGVARRLTVAGGKLVVASANGHKSPVLRIAGFKFQQAVWSFLVSDEVLSIWPTPLQPRRRTAC